jgi:hypothetical protein
MKKISEQLKKQRLSQHSKKLILLLLNIGSK